MKKKLLMLLLVLALCLIPTANAAEHSPSVEVSLVFQGDSAQIRADISAPGQWIEAKVEFRQGTSGKNVWQYTGRSELTVAEIENIVPEQTCTVVVTGTIDGQEFEPVQLVQTG